MKIYLSARYSRREELIQVRDYLERGAGHHVTSRWLDHDQLPIEALETEGDARASMNMLDIARSDEFWAFTELPRTPGKGGDKAEFGYALGRGYLVIRRFGPPECSFHALADIISYERFDPVELRTLPQ